MIQVGGEYRFDALQMRLHPAPSRIRRLSAETPATLVTFDCLVDAGGADLLAAPLVLRRKDAGVFRRRRLGADAVHPRTLMRLKLGSIISPPISTASCVNA